ncbi:hypothetical protein V8C86DRAFT_3099720 [Haematococcus lacustris]
MLADVSFPWISRVAVVTASAAAAVWLLAATAGRQAPLLPLTLATAVATLLEVAEALPLPELQAEALEEAVADWMLDWMLEALAADAACRALASALASPPRHTCRQLAAWEDAPESDEALAEADSARFALETPSTKAGPGRSSTSARRL